MDQNSGNHGALSSYLEQVEIEQRVPVLVLGYLEYAVDVVVGVLAYVVRAERAAEIVAVELRHLPLGALGPVPEHDPVGRRLVQVGRRPGTGVRLYGRVFRGGDGGGGGAGPTGQHTGAGVQRPLLRPRNGDHHPVVGVLQLRYGRGQRRLRQVRAVDRQQTVAHVYGASSVGKSACDNET